METPADASAPPAARLPHDVWAVSLVSLFSDWSYEMILPVLPFFLALVLHASPAEIGAVEGAAVLAQSLAQWYAGVRVAHRPDRRFRGSAGYATTTAAHGLIALAPTWPVVGALRSVGWAGRGIRLPIKQAILADASGPAHRGRAFGLEQALDSTGAILGTAVAVGFVLSEGLSAFRSIFAVSVLPGLVAVLGFSLWVRDRSAGVASAPVPDAAVAPPKEPAQLPRSFVPFLVVGGLFGFGFFNILLVLLAVGDRFIATPGLGEVAAIVLALLVYLVYNLVSALGGYPSGQMADRFPGLALIAGSYLLFAAVDGLLVLGGGIPGGVAVFVVAGFQVSLVTVAQSAWLGRQVPPALRGTAFGVFGAVQGFASLAGSVVVGLLWTAVSPDAGFALSGVVCVLATALLLVLVPREPAAAP